MMAEVVRWLKSGEVKLTAEFNPLKIQSDETEGGRDQGTESNVHVANKSICNTFKWCF